MVSVSTNKLYDYVIDTFGKYKENCLDKVVEKDIWLSTDRFRRLSPSILIKRITNPKIQ